MFSQQARVVAGQLDADLTRLAIVFKRDDAVFL